MTILDDNINVFVLFDVHC